MVAVIEHTCLRETVHLVFWDTAFSSHGAPTFSDWIMRSLQENESIIDLLWSRKCCIHDRPLCVCVKIELVWYTCSV